MSKYLVSNIILLFLMIIFIFGCSGSPEPDTDIEHDTKPKPVIQTISGCNDVPSIKSISKALSKEKSNFTSKNMIFNKINTISDEELLKTIRLNKDVLNQTDGLELDGLELDIPLFKYIFALRKAETIKNILKETEKQIYFKNTAELQDFVICQRHGHIQNNALINLSKKTNSKEDIKVFTIEANTSMDVSPNTNSCKIDNKKQIKETKAQKLITIIKLLRINNSNGDNEDKSKKELDNELQKIRIEYKKETKKNPFKKEKKFNDGTIIIQGEFESTFRFNERLDRENKKIKDANKIQEDKRTKSFTAYDKKIQALRKREKEIQKKINKATIKQNNRYHMDALARVYGGSCIKTAKVENKNKKYDRDNYVAYLDVSYMNVDKTSQFAYNVLDVAIIKKKKQLRMKIKEAKKIASKKAIEKAKKIRNKKKRKKAIEKAKKIASKKAIEKATKKVIEKIAEKDIEKPNEYAEEFYKAMKEKWHYAKLFFDIENEIKLTKVEFKNKNYTAKPSNVLFNDKEILGKKLDGKIEYKLN